MSALAKSWSERNGFFKHPGQKRKGIYYIIFQLPCFGIA